MRQFLPSLTGGGSLPQSLKKDTKKRSGAGGNRTRDLFVANETLYQLSYNPDAPRLTARGERDHCNGNSPVTFASDMSRVPEASMLTGEVSSSLISGNPVLGFLLRAAGRL